MPACIFALLQTDGKFYVVCIHEDRCTNQSVLICIFCNKIGDTDSESMINFSSFAAQFLKKDHCP